MSNLVGYARVSKREQNPEAQEAELRAAGVEREDDAWVGFVHGR